MKTVELLSPNFDERQGAPVEMLVLHYTGMKTAQEAIEKLKDPTPGKRVSTHYMVDEDGTIYRMVPEDKRAWHAGTASWRGQEDVNSRSIGIEIVNPGHEHGYRAFPPAQMQAVAALSKQLVEKYGIPSWNVVAHSDVAPGRKEDPGELFDWKLLAQNGVGLMPGPREQGGLFGFVKRLFAMDEREITPGAHGPQVLKLQKDLARLGYKADICGTYGPVTQQVVTAFQRHFRQNNIDGRWDGECQHALSSLLARVPPAKIAEPDGRMAALHSS